MGLIPLCDVQPQIERALLFEVPLSGIELHQELWSSRV
jgi:hypothetical protein